MRKKMPSPFLKRSVVVAGHKTSISLEDPFWQALREIATERGITSAALIRSIAEQRAPGNLSSAVRVFVLEHLRAASDDYRAWKAGVAAEMERLHGISVGIV